MTISGFSTLVRYDVLSGVWRRWKYYLAATFFFAFADAAFISHANLFLKYNPAVGKFGFTEFLLNVFAGNEPFDPQAKTGIKMSIVWFVFQSFLSFIVGFYAREDLKKSSSLFLLRVKSKARWWTSKFIWCLLSVLAYYIVFVLTCFLFVLVFGDLPSQGNAAVCSSLFGIRIANVGILRILFASLFLPMVISMAMAVFQIALSLIIKPIYSFTVIVAYLAASAFYCSPFLLFNFSMVCRNADFSHYHNITDAMGLLLSLCVTVASYVAGMIFIKTKDIIP